MTDAPRTAAPDQAAVSLRPIEMADASRVHEWASQARSCCYQTWGPNTREETEAFVSEAVTAWQQPMNARFVWAAIGAGDALVGLAENKHLTNTCVEIGYAVHTDCWGRGIGTTIARAQLAMAFADPLTGGFRRPAIQGTPRLRVSYAVRD